MRRAIFTSFGAAIVTVGVLTWPNDEFDRPSAPAVDTTFALGTVVPDFPFVDIDGREWTLAQYSGGSPIVMVMRDALCPVSRRYGPTTSRMAKEFEARDVKFLYVNVSPLDTLLSMTTDRSRYDFIGAYLHDPDWDVARMLGVITTGEVFLLDNDRRLVYRGAIDDQYGIRFTKPAPRENYLRDGLEQLLAGVEIERSSSLPEGCYLASDVRRVDHLEHETEQLD